MKRTGFLVGLAALAAACGGRVHRGTGEVPAAGGRPGAATGDDLHWGEPLACDDLGYDAGGYEFVFADSEERRHFLLLNDDGTLLRIDETGARRLLPDGTQSEVSTTALAGQLGEPAWSNWFLYPMLDGAAILAMTESRAAIFGLESSEVAVFDAPEGRIFGAFSVSSSGNLVFDETGMRPMPSDAGTTVGFGTFEPEQFEIRSAGTRVLASGAPPGNAYAVPGSDDQVVWAEGNELVGVTFDGSEAYRYDLEAEILGFVAAGASLRFLATLSDGLRWVDAVLGRVGPLVEFGSGVPSVRLSPLGEHGAVITGDAGSHVVRLWEGRAVATEEMDVVTGRSFAVNDDGVLAVGGWDDMERALVELVDINGTVLLRCYHPGGVGEPVVSFSRDGRRAIAWYDDRLRLFSVPR